MVFHGKPSLACSLCRTRKIKCDQLRPACSQCLRVSAKCHGYRNPSDLIFCDQRPKVEQKSHIRSTNPSTWTTQSSIIHSETDIPRLQTSHTLPLSPSLSTPESEIAFLLFLQFFDVQDSASGYAFSSCLPQNISTAEEDVLYLAISSIGYARFSKLTSSPERFAVARRKYGRAVRETNRFIETATLAETCAIIRVIVILAVFELITSEEPLSSAPWCIHLEGAATLLASRRIPMSQCVLGRKGLKLFLQLRSQLLTNRLQRNLPVPDVVAELSTHTKPILYPDELLSTELGDILTELANFRAVTSSDLPSDASTSLLALQRLDSELESWAARLPLSWKYQEHACIPSGSFFGEYYHTYSGFSIAATWNQFRIARCLVNNMLLTSLESSLDRETIGKDSSFLDRVNENRNTTFTVCTEMCASVPYFLGQTHPNDVQKPGVGALEIMWPLFICASQECLPKKQRYWAIGQLDSIGSGMGVLQAVRLANLARSKAMSIE